MTKLNKHIFLPLVLVGIAIVIFWMVSLTLGVVAIFIPGIIITFMVYLKTFFKKVSHAHRILPLYLLALAIQFIHFTEEYLTDFTMVVPALLGQEAYPENYWLIFNMTAYAVFVVGGIILLKHLKSLMIIPLFFILVGVVLNSLGHILIAIYVGAYFSGLYSALVYLVIGPILIKRVFDVTRIEQGD